MCEIVFEIFVVDIERGHRHAGHADEAGVVQAVQWRAVSGRKFLDDDHRAVQPARHVRQGSTEGIGCRELGRVVAVQVASPCGASDHQGARMHEARPEAPNADEDRFEACAHAREEILVDHEIRLDRADDLIVLNDQVEVHSINSVHRTGLLLSQRGISNRFISLVAPLETSSCRR